MTNDDAAGPGALQGTHISCHLSGGRPTTSIARPAQAVRRYLLLFAKAEMTVSVAARGFYETCGFVVEGRSELDDQGRPFPLLLMRLAAPIEPQSR